MLFDRRECSLNILEDLVIVFAALVLGLVIGVLVVLTWVEPRCGLPAKYATAITGVDGTRCALLKIPQADGHGPTLLICEDQRYGLQRGSHAPVILHTGPSWADYQNRRRGGN